MMDRIRELAIRYLDNTLRMLPWIIVSAALVGVTYAAQPAQLPVVVYKLSLVTLGTVVAYLVDRTLYLHLQGVPTALNGDPFSAARTLARAIVYAGTVLALTLGI